MLSAHRERHRRVVMMAGFKNRQSYLFDGAGERININAVRTALATTTVGTWTCWVKPVDATPAASAFLIAFGDTDATSDITILNETDGTVALFARRTGTIDFRLNTTNAVLSDVVWTHIGCVQDGADPVLYVNGLAPAQSFSISTNKTIWFNNISGLDNGRIACRNLANLGNIGFLNANVDEVRLWNRALSAAEILNDYNNGKPKAPNTDGLVARFPFDGDPFDGTNFSVRDHQGNNHGATSNMEYADLELDVP